MKRFVIAATLFLLLVGIAVPAEAGFRSLANEISLNDDLDRVWIPFLGVGRVFVKLAHPDGIHDIKLAVFEKRRTGVEIDLDRLVRRHVDLEDWSPMVRANTREDNALIFMQERGENIGIFIAASDGEEVVVIEIELDAERFARELEEDGDLISLARHD